MSQEIPEGIRKAIEFSDVERAVSIIEMLLNQLDLEPAVLLSALLSINIRCINELALKLPKSIHKFVESQVEEYEQATMLLRFAAKERDPLEIN